MSPDPNAEAYARVVASHPWLVGVRPAREVVPGLRDEMILHAGPPTTWAAMSPLMRGGMVGAALFEGLAASPEEAAAKAEAGAIAFGAAQDFWGMAGGVGAITASMPVMVVEDRHTGDRATHILMEGLGRTLVSGAFDAAVLERLVWFRDSLGPLLDRAIRALGGIDIRAIMTEALCRGDELHNRNAAATSLLLGHLALGFCDLPPDSAEHRRVLSFIAGNPQFFVGAVLPATKLMLRAAHDIPGCALVTALAANGTSCGLQLSGLGDRWFSAPVDRPTGRLAPGASSDDVAPACGDSFLVDYAGFGASALPAAPAFGPTIGASLADGFSLAEQAYRVSLGEHPVYRNPALGFRGIPVGVDARAVVRTGIVPAIDIMMCHLTPGIGLIGMGLVSPPLRLFEEAVAALDASGG